MTIKHADINKFILDFVENKENLSFLLTAEGENVDVSIQGEANSQNIGQMFASMFIALPELIQVVKHAIVFSELAIKDAQEQSETMTGALKM